MTDLENIAFRKTVAWLLALQHLLQKLSLLLHLGDFFCSLRTVIGLMPIIISSHNLHQPVSFLQVCRCASPDQLLKLCRLCFFFLLLHLLGRTKILVPHMSVFFDDACGCGIKTRTSLGFSTAASSRRTSGNA